MPYPLPPHVEDNPEQIQALMREYPFAHIFTTGNSGHQSTRLPFMLDVENGKPIRLRAHMNAQNPQASQLQGANVLIAFSGPDSYISPNWRIDNNRGATWDYTAVSVWGIANMRPERHFFEQLINDLAGISEPRFTGLTNRPNWTIADAPTDYVDRLLPHLVAFEISIERVKAIAKLHQDFPTADALSVAKHLSQSDNASSQKIGLMIEERAKQ